jgi:hypothetical protein
MNRDPWSITYRIVANKLKTGNIMSTIKKADGSMPTAGWQETANEIMKCLFLKDDEALEGDRLSTEEEDVVEVNEIREYIHTLKPNKAPGPDGIKVEVYKKTSDITAPFLTQKINDCFERNISLHNTRKQSCLSYTKVETKIHKMQSRIDLYVY